MREIKLSQQGSRYKGIYVALVDDDDFERVNQFRWNVIIGPNTCYAQRRFMVNGKMVTQTMPNFILNGIEADHINHNGLDNQKKNIRSCTHQQNCMNKIPRKNTSSIYKGVSWDKANNKWRVIIQVNKKSIRLGRFKNEMDAAIIYNEAAIKYHKEFSSLNEFKKTIE